MTIYTKFFNNHKEARNYFNDWDFDYRFANTDVGLIGRMVAELVDDKIIARSNDLSMGTMEDLFKHQTKISELLKQNF